MGDGAELSGSPPDELLPRDMGGVDGAACLPPLLPCTLDPAAISASAPAGRLAQQTKSEAPAVMRVVFRARSSRLGTQRVSRSMAKSDASSCSAEPSARSERRRR